MALPKTMLVALLLDPFASDTTAEPVMLVVMPSMSSSRVCAPPSASVMLALVSSK